LVGVADTIYIALDTNIIYRWNTGTNAYVELSPNIVTSLVFNDANGFDGTISLVGSTATLTITTALTQGSVPFIGTSGALTQDNANLFFDDTNNRLGINTNAPTTALDVFGSGIIGRLNGTSTNNAFLGFASAGTNRWSIGNVQSDHRFRIYNETTTSELVSVLSTGEFGIGIANPTTKFHIDGAATALIANLDANVSVAKSISFRSDNSNRINLEVSGTESGSNAGANFFLRTYTDLGALIETPFSIVRSTGVTTIKSLTLTNALSVANGGTGVTSLTSGHILFGNGTTALTTTSNFFWDNVSYRLGILNSSPSYTLDVNGTVRFSDALIGTSATFSSNATATAFIPTGSTVPTNGMYLSAANTLNLSTNSTNRLSIDSSGNLTIRGTSHQFLTNAGATLSFDVNTTRSRCYQQLFVDGTVTLAALISGTTATFSGLITGQSSIYQTNASGNIASNRFGTFNGGATQLFFEFPASGSVAINNGSDKLTIGSGGNLTSFGSYHLFYTNNGLTASFDMNSTRVRCYQQLFVDGNTTISGAINAYCSTGGNTALTIQNTSNNTAATAIAFLGWNSSLTGSIQTYVNVTTYNTSSDYRLKEDLKEFSGLDLVSNLKMYDFKWKEGNWRMYGGLAHEIQKVVPYAATGHKDEVDENGNIVSQGVDYSTLVPILIKSIQELKAEIDILKNK
jgi:hypothetical protein